MQTIAGLAGSLDEMLAVGVEELGPKPGQMALAAGDVLGYAFQGGGGYGDPIKRDPRPFGATSSTGMWASRPRNRNMALSSRDTASIRTLRKSNATKSAVFVSAAAEEADGRGRSLRIGRPVRLLLRR